MRRSRSHVAPLSLSLSLSLSVALAALAAGCATAHEPPAEEVGTLQIPLQQLAADGALYHLSAQFEIIGPGGSILVDGTDFSPSISLTLPPGITTVRVLDGWSLERSVDGGASYTPVSALLGTANPFTLRVLANFSDTVLFQFIVRNPNGNVTITFGVALQPRELAGGMIINTATGDFAPYANRRLDYAVYHNLSNNERINLPDGTKQRLLTAGAVAVEFFNDPFGLLTPLGPTFGGGFLQYSFDAKLDGTQQLTGELDGFADPFPVWTFGPHTFQFGNLPLDADGFPTDVFFNESFVPFELTAFFASGPATLTGELRFRSIPVTN